MKRFTRLLREHWLAWMIVICLFAIAARAVWNFRNPSQDTRLVSIRRAGYPVTLGDLNDYYRAVPDTGNAALIYQQAFQLDLFTNNIFDVFVAKDGGIRRGDVLPEDIRDDLGMVLATNGVAWQLLYSATNFSASRYPLDLREGYMVMLPHLAKIKRAASLLALEGLSHASLGESNQAYAAFKAALQAGESVREEPILISFLVRAACWTIVTRRLEQSLNLVSFEAGQLRSLQQQFAEAEDQRWPARALAGERAFGLSFFIDRHIQRSAAQQGLRMPSGLVGQMALSAYRASGLMAKDRDFYLDTMAQSIARAELPAEERIKAGPAPSMITSNRLLIISRMMLPALAKTLDRATEHSARMRVVETALGVERFRLAHSGALPDRLDQIAPQFLPAVRLDPYDSQPLRYKKLPRGYVVYSIGADRKDDGGAEAPAQGSSTNRTRVMPMDITFVVERQ
jgi:hypothetical protein